MAVTMMSVLVVVLIIRVAGAVVIWMSAFMVAMIMRMKPRSGHILPHVTVQASRRCPGKLKRNDEHDEQDDKTTHGVHATELRASSQIMLVANFVTLADALVFQELEKMGFRLHH